MKTGKRTLREEFEQIASEWDYEMTISPKGWNVEKRGEFCPDNITSGSEYKVWWRCKLGHAYCASIASRTKMKSGCPICKQRHKRSKYEYYLEYYLLKIFKREEIIHGYKPEWLGRSEIDVFIVPLNIGFEYDGEYYHRIRKRKHNDEMKNVLCKENGVTLINFRTQGLEMLEDERSINVYDFKTLNRDILKDKNINIILTQKDSVTEFENVIKVVFEFLGFEDVDINFERDNIEVLNMMYSTILEESLEKKNPQLCEEWNYERNINLLPGMFAANSGEKVWWICKKGHEWEAVIGSRNKGRECPICKNRLLLKGYNDFATCFPQLISQWNYKKNRLSPSDYLAGAIDKVWWICPNGHEYESKICNRTTVNHATACPYCSNKQVLQGFNDLQSQFPDIAMTWDEEKNQGLSPTQVTKRSGKKVWWRCPNNSIIEHSYEMSVDARVRGNGCPYCCTPYKKLFPGLNDVGTLYPEILEVWDYERNSDNQTLNQINNWDVEKKGEFIPKNILGKGTKVHAYFIGSETPILVYDLLRKMKK